MVRMTFLLLSFWMTDGIGSAGGWLDCGQDREGPLVVEGKLL
jgi:hypothetical protein